MANKYGARADIHVVIPGEPVPKGRPRLGRAGQVYTPRQTKQAEHSIGWYVRAAMGSAEPFSGPLDVGIWFWTHRRRGDLDNYVKTVLDACNGVAWADDRQVVGLTARLYRRTGVPACTELSVTQATASDGGRR